MSGEYDSGCASGLDVAWAGAQFGGNLALNVVPGGGEAWAGDAAGNVIKGVVSKRFNEEQQLVLDLAKEANREGGVSWDEGETLVEWAKDAGLEGHGPEIHSATRPSSWAGKNGMLILETCISL